MIVTATERMNWKRCRRMWQYSSANGMYLEPVMPRDYFSLGTMIHTALAEWTANPDGDPDTIYCTIAAEVVEGIKFSYMETVGAFMSDEELGDTYDAVELGRAMMQSYVRRWERPLPEGFRLVSNEQKCIIPIPYTDHSFEIKLDALVADPKDRIYIVERKTYSREPRPIDLDMNEQFTSYIWGASQLGIGEVVGLLYDGLLKRKPNPKTPLEKYFYRDTITRNKHQLNEFLLYMRSD